MSSIDFFLPATFNILDFQQTILEYYKLYGRSFLWRNTSNPYEILVSEIMLQQTQTERVEPKYASWLQRFPDVHSVAAASLHEVLSLWSGLGYNRRARFLREACRELSGIILSSGSFPQSPDKLDALPGIGHYTAHAVATFAFNRPEVFIETNIRSVFLFFFFKDEDIVPDSDIFPLIEKTLYRENPRVWYYALMDYGAALKKTIKNPNRKSAQYAKQSAFNGSNRQARGAILRQLTYAQTELSIQNRLSDLVPQTDSACLSKAELSLAEIERAENISYERLQKAAESLCAEKLIYKTGDLYKIN